MLVQGCCGWDYFKPNQFLEEVGRLTDGKSDWKDIYDHKVQAFADFFDLVEVNKTFYDLPQVKTAEKWKRLAREVNEEFQFTIKASKKITHKDRFSTKESVNDFRLGFHQFLWSNLKQIRVSKSIPADTAQSSVSGLFKAYLARIETG